MIHDHSLTDNLFLPAHTLILPMHTWGFTGAYLRSTEVLQFKGGITSGNHEASYFLVNRNYHRAKNIIRKNPVFGVYATMPKVLFRVVGLINLMMETIKYI